MEIFHMLQYSFLLVLVQFFLSQTRGSSFFKNKFKKFEAKLISKVSMVPLILSIYSFIIFRIYIEIPLKVKLHK